MTPDWSIEKRRPQFWHSRSDRPAAVSDDPKGLILAERAAQALAQDLSRRSAGPLQLCDGLALGQALSMPEATAKTYFQRAKPLLRAALMSEKQTAAVN